MKTMDWKDSFNPRTLSAGWQIYRQHGVDQILRDHHIYFARTGNAWVQTQIEDGQIVTISCTCPQAQAGMLCPHEAAFLFALEDYPDLDAIPSAESPSHKEEQPAAEKPAEEDPLAVLRNALRQRLQASQNQPDRTARRTEPADSQTPVQEQPKPAAEVLNTDEDVHDYVEEAPADEAITEEIVEPAAEKPQEPEILQADEDVHDYVEEETPADEPITEEIVEPAPEKPQETEVLEADEDVHDYVEEAPAEEPITEEIVKPAADQTEETAAPEKTAEPAAEPAVQTAPEKKAEPDSTLPVDTTALPDTGFHFAEMTLEQVLNSLSEKELRSLLLRLCRQSEDNENLILASAPDHLEEEAQDLLKRKLENQLINILSCRHMSRRQAPAMLDSFLRSLQLTVQELEKRESGTGISLLLDLSETAEDNMGIVDLNLLETFLEEEFGMVKTWVSSLNRENLTNLFSWAELHLEQNDLPHLQKELEDLLEKANFNMAELAERKLQVMLNLLETEKKNGRERGARTKHLYEVILNLHDEFPALLDESEAWKSFKESHGMSQGFRILEADRAIADHRTREGEDLLYSLNSEQMTMNEENRFNHLLLETFRLEENGSEMRRLLKHMITQKGMMNAEDLALLQQLETPEEFEEDFQTARKTVRKKELYSFCTSQKLYDRLLGLLEEEPSFHDLNSLNLPADAVDGKRLARLWLSAADKELEGASEFESYVRAVNALNQARRLGLEEEARTKAADWKKKYPHRLSLLSQLKGEGYC